MANANAVVQPVKARADKKPLAPRPKPQAQIRVLQALAELRDGHNGHKLPRRHANGKRRHGQKQVAQQVVEQISRRRVLYAAKGDDLTEKLILRMNNARSTPTAPVAPIAKP